MKKIVLLLFVSCGLSVMADLVPPQTDQKTLIAKHQRENRELLHHLYRYGTLDDETGLRKLEDLLSKGYDPNERGPGGAPLLTVVAKGAYRQRYGGATDLAIAKVLLAHGADPNGRSTFGETALCNVVKRFAFDGQLSFARLLLDKGANPNTADDDGVTPFTALFRRGFDETKLELMKLLLERGADVKRGKGHESVLDRVGDWQIGTQKLDVVRMLVKKGTPVTDGAICSAWRDEPLRRYLLEQSGKTVDDFEVGGSGSTFSVCAKEKNESGADRKRLLPMRSAQGLRQTGHDDSVRQVEKIEEILTEIRQIRERRRKTSKILTITFVATIAFAIVLAVASSFWRRRRGVRDYGTCRHESNVVANYFRCLGKYGVFSGRADRSEYWTFTLTNALIVFLIRFSGLHGIGVAFSIVMLVPGLAAATRRLHDVGRSGWRLMLVLVPSIVVAVFGNMPRKEVEKLGWNEDLFTIGVSFSFYMMLVFGIWNLVLFLRKGVEDGPCDHDRPVDHGIDANESEPVEMIAVSKDEIDMIEASEKRESEEGGSTCKS